MIARSGGTTRRAIVAALAGGARQADVMRTAARGHLTDVLITDDATVAALLEDREEA